MLTYSLFFFGLVRALRVCLGCRTWCGSAADGRCTVHFHSALAK